MEVNENEAVKFACEIGFIPETKAYVNIMGPFYGWSQSMITEINEIIEGVADN